MKDTSASFLPQEDWLSFAAKESDADEIMGNKLSFDLQYPQAPVPFHIDYVDEQDPLSPLLNNTLNLQLDWDRVGLLRPMLNYSLEESFREMAVALKKNRVAVKDDWLLYWIDVDGMDSANELSFYEKVLKRAVKANFSNRPEILRKFAEYCFKEPGKRKWLCSLL
ncbi:hypothetical protein [Paraflavitalea sp. CAU 1676]|uniref:hypothetical protein n=1 Tax=Paraflavitalea sp. CAU 1676 TaxID=3032598 RepID=UPI0023DAC70E|nr:hypothetical protein [Paraflavitalea sp. CAU 1676]MDF2192137.1 hypothetical protein [Paraflavitalea sp. CAU 1676]